MAEPAAWSALALAAHGRADEALRPALWLADIQQDNGAVGMSADLPEPRWCTSLAMLAWTAVDAVLPEPRFAEATARAAAWAVADRGKTNPNDPRIGHDTTLAGWSWAADTHSWLEPSCFFVLGLRAAGMAAQPRVHEGLRLIRNRVLPDGGANYGNTTVLGQTLVPHVQPSGIVLIALAPHPMSMPLANELDAVVRTTRYLLDAVNQGTSPASLAYALLGLTVHGLRPDRADALIETHLAQWLQAAAHPASIPLPPSTHELALLLLAAEPATGWFAKFIVDAVGPGAPL